jgi:hypothetical protein
VCGCLSGCRASCYELFGFDILVDENLKAWLLEINISPSLKYSCDVDYGVKRALTRDIFNLVGFTASDIKTCRNVYVERK